MSRLSDIFTGARDEGRAALVGYLPAGYPTAEASVELVTTLSRYADLIEVGIPFTDPMMDGPTIQEAATTALDAGFRVKDTFTVVRAITDAGGDAVIMSYWNPILQYGPEKFAEELAAAGGLGSIIPDLLPEESARWNDACRTNGLDNVYLVAPSTTPERLDLTVKAGGGFIYAQSHMGVTGAQEDVSADARDLVARTRAATDLPVAVGLGVKTGDHAAAIPEYAAGVIGGSALISAAASGTAALETQASDLYEGVRR
ncbi:tryptophan synthase subunit alpha [Corynebacterium glyciniphilum]|uniref:tryptophan synthase subunit alpha n=1 Tax=Corynebacterium glyciniphilum TaxID=1404244 RepID=UPI00264ED928|nr:tryptophan synthase subunit alpha [Corynebacterium glyciniphilum]MDN5684501.1 tryptophan synthase subunit alpha [Corynebacterium glyciniphilum]